jgi:hypothetical protein
MFPALVFVSTPLFLRSTAATTKYAAPAELYAEVFQPNRCVRDESVLGRRYSPAVQAKIIGVHRNQVACGYRRHPSALRRRLVSAMAPMILSITR